MKYIAEFDSILWCHHGHLSRMVTIGGRSLA